jgi:hypothetical protein
MRLRRQRAAVTPATPALSEFKLQVVDEALTRAGARSMADLGGVWAVDGGYTLSALERHPLDRAVLVDAYMSPSLVERQRVFRQLELIDGNFGAADMPARVGPVDVMLLFDVLLHQVRPDWDEILARYAPSARCFAIVNPQWTGSNATVRLLDLGEAEYRAVVPPQRNLDGILSRLDEHNERHDRPYRDIFEIWQWGIVDADLLAALDRLGFDLVWSETTGPFEYLSQGQRGKLASFDNRGFVFIRR